MIGDTGFFIRLFIFLEVQLRLLGIDVEPETQRICDKLREYKRKRDKHEL